MLKIALVAPPWLRLPPLKSGGVEAVIHSLTRELSKFDVEVVLFSVGTTQTLVENRFLFPDEVRDSHELCELNHLTYCLKEAADADLIHLHSDLAIPLTRFLHQPVIHTLHHPVTTELCETIRSFPNLHYVTVSEFQKARIEEQCGRIRVSCIYNGIDLSRYPIQEQKDNYLCYLGRIAPQKGVEHAIEVSRRCGVPLKIAGPTTSRGYQRQTENDEYFRNVVEPRLDGRSVQYVGELGFEEKVELLRRSRGLLFPVKWEEPFGLVIAEAMACGTPVLALRRGSVPELVLHGRTGFVVDEPLDLEQYVWRLQDISPAECRKWVEHRFSLERMAGDYRRLYAQARREAVEPAGIQESQRLASATSEM